MHPLIAGAVVAGHNNSSQINFMGSWKSWKFSGM